MSTQVQVFRGSQALWEEGLTCDGTRVVLSYRQDPGPGQDLYLVDLESRCNCGKRFRDHELFGIAIGVVDAGG